MSSAWTVSGTSSKVVIGNGTNSVNFTVPSSNALTGTVDVRNNATLVLQNTTLPTLGTLSSGSSVVFDGNSSLTIPVANYHNLSSTNDAGAARTLASGTIGIAGTFTPGAATYTTTGNTISFNGASAQTIPAFTFGGLSIDNASVTTPSDITVNGVYTVNQNFTASSVSTLGSTGSLVIAATKTFTVSGTFDNQSTTAITLNGTMVVSGTYRVNAAVANSYILPTITFQSGSNLNILQGAPRLPQTVGGNVTWSSTGTGTFLNNATNTIGGTLTVSAGQINNGSGGTGRTLTVGALVVQGGEYDVAGNGATVANTLNITGNLTISGGIFYPSAVSSTVGTGIVNIGGNINHTAGSFGVANANLSGSIILNGTTQSISTIGFTNTPNLTIGTSSPATAPSVTLLTDLTIPATSTLLLTDGNLTIAAGKTLTISGAANFNGKSVTLQSNVSGTAAIGVTAASGLTNATNVTLQRYIPGGKRAFRFLGHPFSTALNLSALTDNILITGGSGTGFTSSTTNNPSAFWYNPATGNESTTSDPGWTAFTTADGTSGAGNIWSQYEGIRVLVRGSIADGLSPVTPSPVTLDATGTLNTGTQTIAVTKGTNSGFNLISNPFASNINLTTAGGNITLGSNLVTNHYVWDISAGTKGGWVNTAFSSSYVLPSFSAFFVKTAANDNITITEAAKTSTAATGTLFRNTNASPQMVRLWVLGNNITWDKFELYYNKESVLENDKHDGVKMFNSEVNLYSLNNSGMYSIDSRPYVQDDVIPLGFTSAVQQTYTIKATDFNMPAGVELYLRDKFLGTETKLVEDAEYTFSVTNNPASQGNARFEIAQKAAPLQPVVTSFYVKLSPNPAKGMVKVSFSNEELLNTQINIVNAEGKMVKQVNAGNVQAANLNINISDLAKGIYYVTLQNGKEKKTETLQVQ